MLITEKGMIIRLNTADISTIGRNTQGVRLIQLEEGDHLVSVARLAEREERTERPASEPRTAMTGMRGGHEHLGARPGWRWRAGARPAAHPEKRVVDQYFNAVNAKDNQTLSSFAAVTFDKKVERWKIKSATPRDARAPPPCPSSPRR